MTRRCPAMVLVLLLGACAGTLAPPDAVLTPAQHVYSLKGQFEAILKPLAIYEAQPRCTETIVVACSDADLVAKIREVLPDVQAALDEAEAAVRAQPDQPAPAATIQIVRSGLARLNAYLAQTATGGDPI